MSPVDELMKMLEMPSDHKDDNISSVEPLIRDVKTQWINITSDDILYTALYQMVQGELIYDLDKMYNLIVKWGESHFNAYYWEGKWPSPKQQELLDYPLVRTMIWCAGQAAKFRAEYRGQICLNEIERASWSLGFVHGFMQELKTWEAQCNLVNEEQKQRLQALLDLLPAWAWGCVRTFLNAGMQRHLFVHIAFTQEGGDTGGLAKLELELLQEGAGVVFRHPQDIFVHRAEPDFLRAIQDAWQAATTALTKADSTQILPIDGRWRLQPEVQGGVKMPEPIQGNSAGGAAARGWWYAIANAITNEMKLLDSRIIVLAAIDPQGKLTGVSGIAAKVRAIAVDERFDTIVVANCQNAEEAKGALGRSSSIRVVNLENGSA